MFLVCYKQLLLEGACTKMSKNTLCLQWCAVFLALLIAGTCSADLVAHWKLDEPEGTEGEESIEDTGMYEMFNGTPVFPEQTIFFGGEGAQGYTGTSVQVAQGSIEVPYDADLNPESFTVSMWALANSTAGYQSVITSRHDLNPNLAGYILYNNDQGLWSFWTGRTGGWDGLNGPAVEVSVWTHLVISFDAETNTKALYVNGMPYVNTAQLYVPNAAMNLHIGSGGDLGTQYYFDGSIDDVALWNVALEEEEVAEVRSDGPIVRTENLVAHWALDEPEGTMGAGAVSDAISGFDGNVVSAQFLCGQAGANESTGTAIALNKVFIDVPYAPELNPESFTVTAWVKPTTTAGYQSVITSRQDINLGAQTQGYIIYNDANGNWAFWTGQGAPGWPGVVGPTVIVDEWQHLAISYDAETTTKKLYFDGVEMAAATDQIYVPNDLQNLHIGSGGDLGDQFHFSGLIDDVGLWDEALSAEDIQEVMENGIGGGTVEILFKRGDCNIDGSINVADAVYILSYLFAGGDEPACKDAVDANDDGTINLADAVQVLAHLFAGSGDLAPPFDECGTDPTDDALDCLSFPPCGG